jgi:hypothetical protein
MPRYSNSAAKAAQGIAYVASTAAQAGCILHQVNQEYDLGVDAFLELIRENEPINKLVALQVKTGRSYWKGNGDCQMGVGKHKSYWEKHPLPVFGIVVNDAAHDAAWVNLKNALKSKPEAGTVAFRRTKTNRFDAESLRRIMIPLFDGKTADLEFGVALQFLNSNEASEVYMAVNTLFRRFGNRGDTWQAFCQFFIQSDVELIPPVLAYYLAHIPWHGDIFAYGELPDANTTAIAKKLIESFGANEVRKLISLIDDRGIERGTIGQSVEAVITSIPGFERILSDIVRDEHTPMRERESAAEILAMKFPDLAMSQLSILVEQGSPFCEQMLQFLTDYGHHNPYG